MSPTRQRSCLFFLLPVLIIVSMPSGGIAENEPVEAGAAPQAQNTATPPGQSGQAILIRNTPFQPTASPAASGVLSSGSSGQTDPAPQPAAQAKPQDPTKLVVCLVKGHEVKGLSDEACKAQGGRVTVTAEVAKTDKTKTGTKT